MFHRGQAGDRTGMPVCRLVYMKIELPIFSCNDEGLFGDPASSSFWDIHGRRAHTHLGR